MIDDLLNTEEILDHILGDAIDVNRFHIPDNEMKFFLSYVSKQKVALDPEANEMLENYFQATRMIRPSKKMFRNFDLILFYFLFRCFVREGIRHYEANLRVSRQAVLSRPRQWI